MRGYGQKNPLDEYKRESFDLFQNLLMKIKENLILFLSNLEVSLDKDGEDDKITEDKNKSIDEELLTANSKEKISRNAKCPCGSDKKFKHCCGSLV